GRRTGWRRIFEPPLAFPTKEGTCRSPEEGREESFASASSGRLFPLPRMGDITSERFSLVKTSCRLAITVVSRVPSRRSRRGRGAWCADVPSRLAEWTLGLPVLHAPVFREFDRSWSL